MAGTSDLKFRDINITFKKHPVTDDVVVSKDAAAIKQSIANILLTNKGERLFAPDFGSDIRAYLFEPLDYATAASVTNSIKYTIGRYEPRINLLSIVTIPNMDDNRFDVEMTYEIRGADAPPTTIELFLTRTR